MELTVIQETLGRKPSRDEYSRTASIGGGLPLLLLSVLPPVIPRASWPSAENAQQSMRRSVTFSSEPKLDENKCQPAIDLYNLRLLNKRQEENTGILARIRNLFGSRPASRKTSSASIAGNSGAGIAAALKLHMGMIAGLVPGAQKNNMVLSCNTLDVHTPINLRRESYAHSGPTINILTDEMYESGIGECSSRPKEEIFTYPGKPFVFQKQNPETEPRVNFQLPQNPRRPSMTHQISQPILSFKDRAKGSPRFPHKIVPTCSLSTLDDQRKSSAASSSNPLSAASLNPNNRRSSHQPQANKQRSRTSVGCVMGGRWKSMEDATLTLPGSRRGSGLLAISYIPSNVYHSPRQSMTVSSPSCDVWATADFGIPLSQLDVEIEGQHAKYIRKDTSETSLS